MTAWQRHERIGDCDLYLGDCLEVMPELGRFDAVVTDPPYGIGRDGQKQTRGGHGGRKAYDFKGWDIARPKKSVFELMLSIAGQHVIWGGNYFADLLPPAAGWLVWDKGQRINQSDGELAYSNHGGALRIFEKNRVSLLIEKAKHPTQKPLAVMRRSVEHVKDAKTILDPFMGSGSTGVACVQLGRRFTGIELDPEYFDIACKRIEAAVAEPRLALDEPPPKAEQTSMF